MNPDSKKYYVLQWFCAGVLGLAVLSVTGALAQDQQIQSLVSQMEQSKAGMTLWDTIKSGGFVMIVLCVLSVVATAFIVYNFFTLSSKNLVPKDFSESLIEKLETKKTTTAKSLCKENNNIISRVASAGLEKIVKGPTAAREAMENVTRKEIGNLWQNISYLADIAAIAPLIGLLGTVLGMIQAFNVIAFQSAVVKPLLLAGGVSKAMVTTAGGLVVAIPVMLFYSYFRGRVQDITNMVETYSTDVIKTVEELGVKNV